MSFLTVVTLPGSHQHCTIVLHTSAKAPAECIIPAGAMEYCTFETVEDPRLDPGEEWWEVRA